MDGKYLYNFDNAGAAFYDIAQELRISEPQFESFCHVLTSGLFDHYAYPRSEAQDFYPSLPASMQYIDDLLKSPNFDADNNFPDANFMNLAIDVASNRLIYRTVGGALGMAPACAEPGDIVVALLGFATAMILRRGEGNTYKVVGESYCYGYMACEGFLGPLPSTHKFVWINDRSESVLRAGFIQNDSDVPTVEDPRLGPLPDGWKFVYHDKRPFFREFENTETGEITEHDPRLLPEALLARGVAVQYFDLT